MKARNVNALDARRGFTLIELLVVLTIIGLLAALLLPVFASTRERARLTGCESNLRQIGIAIHMYQDDNGGALPRNFGDAGSIPADAQSSLDAEGMSHGGNDLQPYEHDPNIYHCPERRFPVPDAPYLRDDYGYRVSFLMQFQEQSGHRALIMKPTPSSVLAYDENHRQGIETNYLVLRADGAVSAIPSSRVVFWFYMPNGQWTDGSGGMGRFPSTDELPVFPNETWPPQFDK